MNDLRRFYYEDICLLFITAMSWFVRKAAPDRAAVRGPVLTHFFSGSHTGACCARGVYWEWVFRTRIFMANGQV